MSSNPRLPTNRSAAHRNVPDDSTNSRSTSSDDDQAPEAAEAEAGPEEGGEASNGQPTAPPESLQPSDRERRSNRVTRFAVAEIVIASVAVSFALYFGRAILLPIAFALLMAVTLRPVVRSAKRRRVPESISAAALVVGILGLSLTSVYFLAGPIQEWSTDLPERMEEVGQRLSVVREQVKSLEEASDRLEEIAGSGGDQAEAEPEPEKYSTVIDAGVDEPETKEPVPVEVQQPRLAAGFDMLSSAGGLAASIVISLVMTFFLLSQGDVLLNNLVRVLPTNRDKRNTVAMVYRVEKGISHYLLTVSLINGVLGIFVGSALWLIGMPNPALWGLMAALLNFVPFAGALVGAVIVFFVAVLSFDSLAYAALVPLVYLTLTTIEGNAVTPAILGRTMQLNPIMVLLALIFWGWIWGVGGALLAVPMLAMIKIGCERFQRTQSIGTLLGGDNG